MSSRFLWHILRLPVSFYAQRFAGEISNRSSLNDQVAEVLSGKLATTAIDAVMIIFYALIMFQYDLVLTLLTIIFAAVNIFTLQWVSRQRVDANQRLMQEYGKAAGTSIAALQSIETLKASGLESDFFSRWSGYYTKAINSQQELGVTNQIFSVLPALVSSLSAACLLVVGGFRVINGHLSIGMIIAFQMLMDSFLEPVNNLVNFGSTLQELEGNLIRLDDVLCNPVDPQIEHSREKVQKQKISDFQGSSSLSTPYQNPRLQGYVELKNITFGYSQLDSPLIENFNLLIKPGQRIALVGGSGSGKSTIAKVVAGLYEAWTGEVLFDNVLRSEIPLQVLTNSVAMVEQDILMFSGSVRDNLTLWDTTVPDKNLIQACQDAAINDILLSMPGGYDAELIEGATNLSGGQRQRLGIARALVNNPSILIMDEATSALDTETEKIVDQNLRRRGCTCIIVAHRLSTIRDCDEIIVLQSGKEVQRGTLVAVVVAIVTVSVTMVSSILLVNKVRPLLEMEGNIFGQTVQLINGISTLRIAGAEIRAFAVWSRNYSKQVKLDLSTQYIEDAVELFNTVMPTLTSAALFWFAISLLQESPTAAMGFSAGTFLAFNTAFGAFIKGATDVSNIVTDTLQILPQWQRAQPILQTIPEVDLSKADPGKLTGKITIDRIKFRYREDGPLILENVSIRAQPGDFIALVGGSGSGKSTIFRLLLGFETPEDGTIYYDGQDLSGLDVDAVRRQLGVVLQSGRLTSASIFENIAGGAQITLDEAWEAAQMSGFADDVAAMPMEMHTVVSEGGGNLSGGQRQRLLIARALALKPRILLFDEATSALDNKTQAIVSESLDKLQVTRIVIAHRLSTIRNANRIYVLQASKVLQQGSFEELAFQEGLFAQLMARQMA